MADIAAICDLIRAALRSRRLLRISYRLYSRLVEPWALIADEGGHDVLIAWQVSGGSESGPAIGWTELQIAEVVGVVVMSDSFASNPERTPPLRAHLQVDQPAASQPTAGRVASRQRRQSRPPPSP